MSLQLLLEALYTCGMHHISTSKLVTVDDDKGPVNSVNWTPDGCHIAIGLNNSEVQLWDSISNRQLRIRGGHRGRVGSLAWKKNHILTTGSVDGQIINNDVRIRDHVIETYRGRSREICGLKWSYTGQQLASGGNDNLLHIWYQSLASSDSTTQWLHRLEDHKAAVKAFAWCPLQNNLLASGRGVNNQCIKFWNTGTGACLNSVDNGSQICSFLWSKNEGELRSSHGFTQNQLMLWWKYPSMLKMAELTGHSSRALFTAQGRGTLYFRVQMGALLLLLLETRHCMSGMYLGLRKQQNLHKHSLVSHFLT